MNNFQLNFIQSMHFILFDESEKFHETWVIDDHCDRRRSLSNVNCVMFLHGRSYGVMYSQHIAFRAI